jgi:ribosomal protein S18 acetylase RimI-like enzyme
LRATPRVDDVLGQSSISLWPQHVGAWNGMIFVSLADSPPPLGQWLADHTPDLATFDALRIDALAVGARTERIVHANWKIIVENYLECLHCAIVHPELVEILPLYRTGHVVVLGVSPAWRRRGIGRELMARLAGAFVARGVRRMHLAVRTTNEGARTLAEGLGVSVAGRRLAYYTNGDDGYLMVKTVR